MKNRSSNNNTPIRKRILTIQDHLPQIKHNRSSSDTEKSNNNNNIMKLNDIISTQIKKKVTFLCHNENNIEKLTFTDPHDIPRSNHQIDLLVRRSNQMFQFLKMPKFDFLSLIYTYNLNSFENSDSEITHSILTEFIALIILYLMRNDYFPEIHASERVRFNKALLMHHFLWMNSLINHYSTPEIVDFHKRFDAFVINQSHYKEANLVSMTQLLNYVIESVIQKNINNEILRDQLNYQLLCTSIEIANNKIKNKLLPLLKSMNNSAMHYYLPQADVYTLVLDMDETLIYYDYNLDLLYRRPYLQLFLRQMSHLFELVIFTAGLEQYANDLINQFDQNKYIKYRLYRQHTVPKLNYFQKDLRKLGRPLQKTLIIDNTPQNFNLQPENGIQIQSWIGDQKDQALRNLIPFLKKIRLSGMDVRQALNQNGK